MKDARKTAWMSGYKRLYTPIAVTVDVASILRSGHSRKPIPMEAEGDAGSRPWATGAQEAMISKHRSASAPLTRSEIGCGERPCRS